MYSEHDPGNVDSLAGNRQRARAQIDAARRAGCRYWQMAAAERVELSMGKSTDFERTTKEGATTVRLATAIFRPHSS